MSSRSRHRRKRHRRHHRKDDEDTGDDAVEAALRMFGGAQDSSPVVDPSPIEGRHESPEASISITGSTFSNPVLSQLLEDVRPLTPTQIRSLCRAAKEHYDNFPNLLDLKAPICIVGDLHGQDEDLMTIFRLNGPPSYSNQYLFLGDYINRGKASLRIILLMFALSVEFKSSFFCLRGNHESVEIAKMYGFWEECKRSFETPEIGEGVFNDIMNACNYLPLCATINKKLFCVHGGLSPKARTVKDIELIERRRNLPVEGVLCDILWGDPSPSRRGFYPSNRGAGYLFGPDRTKKFLRRHRFERLIRAHQLQKDGYAFAHSNLCVTVFSASNYCYRHKNKGAILVIDQDGECEFLQYYANYEESPEEAAAALKLQKKKKKQQQKEERARAKAAAKKKAKAEKAAKKAQAEAEAAAAAALLEMNQDLVLGDDDLLLPDMDLDEDDIAGALALIGDDDKSEAKPTAAAAASSSSSSSSSSDSSSDEDDVPKAPPKRKISIRSIAKVKLRLNVSRRRRKRAYLDKIQSFKSAESRSLRQTVFDSLRGDDVDADASEDADKQKQPAAAIPTADADIDVGALVGETAAGDADVDVDALLSSMSPSDHKTPPALPLDLFESTPADRYKRTRMKSFAMTSAVKLLSDDEDDDDAVADAVAGALAAVAAEEEAESVSETTTPETPSPAKPKKPKSSHADGIVLPPKKRPWAAALRLPTPLSPATERRIVEKDLEQEKDFNQIQRRLSTPAVKRAKPSWAMAGRSAASALLKKVEKGVAATPVKSAEELQAEKLWTQQYLSDFENSLAKRLRDSRVQRQMKAKTTRIAQLEERVDQLQILLGDERKTGLARQIEVEALQKRIASLAAEKEHTERLHQEASSAVEARKKVARGSAERIQALERILKDTREQEIAELQRRLRAERRISEGLRAQLEEFVARRAEEEEGEDAEEDAPVLTIADAPESSVADVAEGEADGTETPHPAAAGGKMFRFVGVAEAQAEAFVAETAAARESGDSSPSKVSPARTKLLSQLQVDAAKQTMSLRPAINLKDGPASLPPPPSTTSLRPGSPPDSLVAEVVRGRRRSDSSPAFARLRSKRKTRGKHVISGRILSYMGVGNTSSSDDEPRRRSPEKREEEEEEPVTLFFNFNKQFCVI